MQYAVLIAGLKGALFLESLPRAIWPSKIFYYKVHGEAESAHQRLVEVAGDRAELISPRHFEAPKDFDVVFTIGWQYLLKNSGNVVVLHDSLLPRYRGFAPTVSALLNGDRYIGVTAIVPVGDIDAGPILAQHSVEVEELTTVQHAFEAISGCYVACVTDLLEMGGDFRTLARPQDETRATYSVWRDPDDLRVNWGFTSKEVVRMVNSVGYPYSGAVSSIGDREIVIMRSELTTDVDFELRQPGKVWQILDSTCADVICGTGMVRIWVRWMEGDGPAVFTRLRTRLN